MLNFYEELAGHGMVTGVGSATMRKQKKPKFKTPSLEASITKNEGPTENIGCERGNV